MIDFLVVDCPSAYNAILGRPALNQLRAVTSTYHLLMCFPIEKGVEEVKGDQVAANKCCLASLKGEPAPRESMSIDNLKVRDKRAQVVAKPRGELEDVILNPDAPNELTWVGSNLSEEFKAWL